MARVSGDEVLVKYGLDVLTVAVLAILTTAPIGALGIGLAGPRLLTRHPEDTHADRKEGDLEADTETPQKDMVTFESKL
ncbi:sodium/hydrogen exchanger 9B2-like [Oncorhynchus nerka]